MSLSDLSLCNPSLFLPHCPFRWIGFLWQPVLNSPTAPPVSRLRTHCVAGASFRAGKHEPKLEPTGAGSQEAVHRSNCRVCQLGSVLLGSLIPSQFIGSPFTSHSSNLTSGQAADTLPRTCDLLLVFLGSLQLSSILSYQPRTHLCKPEMWARNTAQFRRVFA